MRSMCAPTSSRTALNKQSNMCTVNDDSTVMANVTVSDTDADTGMAEDARLSQDEASLVMHQRLLRYPKELWIM